MFRFLYGRWIRSAPRETSSSISRSDSSMVDEYNRCGLLRFGHPLSSDSSMVDEYSNWVHQGGFIWRGSDSSMVDEYHLPVGSLGTLWNVQIPLWSMNTRYLKLYRLCQWVQIPLWSMNTWLSSSSGVLRYVQIPLWSMNTRPRTPTCRDFYRFRFLYGRWIHW